MRRQAELQIIEMTIINDGDDDDVVVAVVRVFECLFCAAAVVAAVVVATLCSTYVRCEIFKRVNTSSTHHFE